MGPRALEIPRRRDEDEALERAPRRRGRLDAAGLYARRDAVAATGRGLSSGEEEVVESGRAPATPDKDDDGLSGMLSSLSVAAPAPAAAPKDAADALDAAALASISLGSVPGRRPKKKANAAVAVGRCRRYQRALVLDVEDRMKSPRARDRGAALRIRAVFAGDGRRQDARRRGFSGKELPRRGGALRGESDRALDTSSRCFTGLCAVVEWDRDLSIKPLADDRPTVYVATIQGLRASGALQKPLDGVACVVIDEVITAPRTRRLSLLFAGLKSNASAKVLGLDGDALSVGGEMLSWGPPLVVGARATVQELVAFLCE